MLIWRTFLIRRLWLSLPLIALLAACSSAPKTPQLSERQFYEEAQKAIDGNNMSLAIERLQGLESRYPFGRYASQAKLDLIYCHYRAMDYEASAATAERFINTNPDHPQLDYAYYMKGLASYSVDRGLLERFIPSDFTERDMGPARESFEDFNRLINRFPNSVYAADAQQRMVYLRNLLAAYELRAAEFYMRRGAYVAAANRGRYVVENFDTSPSVADALVIMAEAYTELDQLDLRDSTVTVLEHNYPSHPRLAKTGGFEYQKSKRGRRSLASVLTFGLVN
ncbi:outer membrane protein assembly factor BamD [Ketobacter alkanivorans]|uniref:Outer membrane protein assembly factor BamD n=1 Tax=Ketobacter alkanivorans TaxID=1917421 RepID=A0A2K9LI86_9GAMM|nr:outer membrane protein assembly factor BamD [Ketobacter alkanivorans]AUM11947.1 outer membrane protein assembly factor BamD [Ketobacter alkanivorans]